MRIKSELSEFENTGEINYLFSVLKKVAKAKGWTNLERETGISRPALYAALTGKSSPRIDTISSPSSLDIHLLTYWNTGFCVIF